MNLIEESLWTQIQKPIGEELPAKHIFFDLSKRLFIALDRMGFRHILIESTSEIHSPFATQFKGVQVSIRELVVSGGSQKEYIDLICREPSGYHIFNSIGGEIAQKIAETSEDSDSIGIITAILAKWKQFWGSFPQDILTMEEQVGLFGELFFLRYWLLPRYGKQVVLAWKGPSGERHDFILGDRSFEVKTSTSSTGHVHRINGVDQLEELSVGGLYLSSFWLRQNERAEYSLASIIESCREYVEPDVEIFSAFNLLLSRSGYSELQRTEYEKRRYEIIESALFLVDDQFPKITRTSFSTKLPDQIEELDYSINLNSYLEKSLCSSEKEFLSLEI